MNELINGTEVGQRVFHLLPRAQAALRVSPPVVKRIDGQIEWTTFKSGYSDYLGRIYNHTSGILPEHDTTEIDSLWLHNRLGMEYKRVLHQYDGVRALDPEKTVEQSESEFLAHDGPRYVGNGRYRLLTVEDFLKRLQIRMLTQMLTVGETKEFLSNLHTTDWMIGRIEIPTVDKATSLELNQLLNKFADNCGKLFNGSPVHPYDVVRPGGLLDAWKKRENERDRFPARSWVIDKDGSFSVTHVDIDTYSRRDRNAFQESCEAVERLTKVPVEAIWLQVNQRLGYVQ